MENLIVYTQIVIISEITWRTMIIDLRLSFAINVENSNPMLSLFHRKMNSSFVQHQLG